MGDLAFYLATEGFDVNIVTGRQTYDDSNAQLLPQEIINNVHIFRVWTSSFGRSYLLGRSIDYLSFYITALWCLFKLVHSGDLLVAKTDPPLISVVAAIIAKIKNGILINWVQDLFPDVAEVLGIKGVSSIGPLLKYLRNKSLNLAHRNVVIGASMKRLLIDAGISTSKVQIIHNWADEDSIHPISSEISSLRIKWGLADKYVVGYSGNMGRAHEFETLLDAAEMLLSNTQVFFLFIGGGAQRAFIESEVARRALVNVRFYPYQPRSDLAESLSAPDLHIVSLRPALEGLIVPSKYYGIAAAGRPILFIGSQSGEIAQLISASSSGAAVDIGDAKKVAEFIERLASNHGIGTQMGENARNYFEDHFTRTLLLSAWQSLLASIDDENR